MKNGVNELNKNVVNELNKKGVYINELLKKQNKYWRL